ncbi:MAG: hypothetical protein ACRD4R_10500 [Candidatus Acidiferrales bacterium]
MGGRGPGHKSERARAARLRNIHKARAARKRAPLPWRSGIESRVIQQLVWQWWNDPGSRKWPAYRVARFLGVSHTWVNKLVKSFHADPHRVRRRMRAFAPATFATLLRAREETRRQRQRGWLRGPIRWRKVAYTLGQNDDRAQKRQKQSTAVVPNESERRRAAGLQALPPLLPRDQWPSWAAGFVSPASTAGSVEASFGVLPPRLGSQSVPPPETSRPLDANPAIDSPPDHPRKKRPIPFAFHRPRR